MEDIEQWLSTDVVSRGLPSLEAMAQTRSEWLLMGAGWTVSG